MIQSYKDRRTERVADGTIKKGFPQDLVRRAQQMLAVMDAAHELRDLRLPPGNRLEALQGNLAGKHSLRINDQWRIVFIWTEAGPAEVEIMDYH
ncbi:type II toxin-antitoxin system RelE/ParE family toxin [Roseibium aggregatum]|uniref:type II toxin-antitoxin system RelE/ParE family toxin n=1 Tax=Roseibium aggregatum TaxID=187304 RepID=UPI001A8FCDEF|nr:type II toxin-antitoxin system RelE/ParE family toxin [Roseibium aggregatum]MBN8180068.1 type II toxin-antitoxin system RelE/ParE family toxin [Roseibium aggregatum]UES45769.1 type II toxin-antitoxin system RelE/ParE family toxin [Roseibium aggregatum]